MSQSKVKKRVSIDVRSIKAQGPRQTMEDRLCIQSVGKNLLLLAVFDGHGGAEVAEMCAARAPIIMKSLLSSNPDISECIRNLYRQLDEEAKAMNVHQTGTTAAIALYTDDRVWFSNCGDAMIALKMRDGGVKFVTQDHKVENEKTRIERLGGMITYYGGCARIFGTLNIARSIGDHYLKTYVISDPYVTATSFPKSEIEWIVIASDGLWDVFTPEAVEENLRANEHSLATLLHSAYNLGCSDNITVIHSKFQVL